MSEPQPRIAPGRLNYRRTGREFPFLGQTERGASSATRAVYFATAPWARVNVVDDKTVVTGGGPFHAKEMGTLVTACGKSTASWIKLWDVPFLDTSAPVCSRCKAIVLRAAQDPPPRP